MTNSTEVPGPAETRQLREAADKAREDLGDTVGSLAAKADLKAQVREKLEVVKGSVQDTVAHTARAAKEHTPPALQDKAAQVAHDKRSKPIAGIVAGLAAAAVTLKMVFSRRGRKGKGRTGRR
jgi:hypothetical protein